MSNWTHVAAIARIDAIRWTHDDSLDIEKLFGKECRFESSSEVWREVDEHPERFLPMGSEGSLRMSVWANPDLSNMAAYTVSIFGDLRDHDDGQVIIEWFKSKLSELDYIPVRQATITVMNELNGTYNWTYIAEEEG